MCALVTGVQTCALPISAVPRRAAAVHRRGHQRDAAHHHRPATGQAGRAAVMSAGTRPLEGMRVLTLEQFGAGPYGSMYLADLGAAVIKVENPGTGGDAGRGVGPHFLGPDDSQYFQTWGSNKKSVALDLKTPAGQAGFREQIGRAHV